MTGRDVTQLRCDYSRGGSDAADRLVAIFYEQLRAVARQLLKPGAANQTLQPTALVHEAYFRLVSQSHTTEMGRTHFLNLAARAMRQVLTDHARRHRAAKRGGQWQRVYLGEVASGSTRSMIDVVALDDALSALAELDERQARIVELRYLAGMTIPEVATALDVSPRTVELDWRMARAGLGSALATENRGDQPSLSTNSRTLSRGL